LADHITSLFKCIPKLMTGDRFIVGIDGLSRSGKTTLVEKFSRKLTEEHIEVCISHLEGGRLLFTDSASNKRSSFGSKQLMEQPYVIRTRLKESTYLG
jgi:thymidylate kinase